MDTVDPAENGNGTAAQDEFTLTWEAFGDTVIPGEKRWPGDRAIAGAATGGGAVQAGWIELIMLPATGFGEGMADTAPVLNDHAKAYAAEQGLVLDTSVPAFTALPFEHRTALIQVLTAPGHPEKDIWVGLTMFATMAFDTAAHMHTVDAIAQGHPGLTLMGFAHPDADGRWRFPNFSYGRPLARLHPQTTESGSPA